MAESFLTLEELNRIVRKRPRSRKGQLAHWAAVIVRNVRYFEWDVAEVKLALTSLDQDWPARK